MSKDTVKPVVYVDDQRVLKMLKFREMTEADNEAVAALIRANLEQFGLDIPGTVYFDAGLDHLSDFYGTDDRRYFVIENAIYTKIL